MIRFLACLSLIALLGACDAAPEEAQPVPPGDFVSPAEVGCESLYLGLEDISHMGPGAGIGGRVLGANCEPLGDFKVLSCTAESCVPTDTLEDGSWYLSGIMNELPRKIRVVGVTHGHYDALFYLEIKPNELAVPSKNVILAPLSDYIALDAAAGGVALMAEGQLEVTIGPEALKYPLGHFTSDLSAQRVSTDLVGPFDIAPWEGRDGAMAFIFDPYDLSVDPENPATLAIDVADHAAVGTVYDIWSAETYSAHVVPSGTATVGEDGVIRSDADAPIISLQTLVLVPQ